MLEQKHISLHSASSNEYIYFFCFCFFMKEKNYFTIYNVYNMYSICNIYLQLHTRRALSARIRWSDWWGLWTTQLPAKKKAWKKNIHLSVIFFPLAFSFYDACNHRLLLQDKIDILNRRALSDLKHNSFLVLIMSHSIKETLMACLKIYTNIQHGLYLCFFLFMLV